MHKLEYVIQNETKFFELQTDHLLQASTYDLILIKKKKWTTHLVDFTFQAKRKQKIDQYLVFARKLKKLRDIVRTI